jgi:hypothetical protein
MALASPPALCERSFRLPNLPCNSLAAKPTLVPTRPLILTNAHGHLHWSFEELVY